MSSKRYRLTELEELESEAIYILREAHAQFENPCILFSGGKDSIVMTHLAVKAFSPGNLPLPLLHIDTGHNFQETLDFRDSLVKDLGIRLVVGRVEDSIKQGKVVEETGVNASRNTAQIVTLLDMLESQKFDAALGGARRDEEKARAKERIFSHRNEFGQWDPKNQRPELWDMFNGKKRYGEHFRVFPISNWTELNIWQYIKEKSISLPSLYFSHKRSCIRRGDTILAESPYLTLKGGEKAEELQIRFRTIGDLTITGGLESTASNIDEVIEELVKSQKTERGSRADDQRSDAAMEERKKEGYF